MCPTEVDLSAYGEDNGALAAALADRGADAEFVQRLGAVRTATVSMEWVTHPRIAAAACRAAGPSCVMASSTGTLYFVAPPIIGDADEFYARISIVLRKHMCATADTAGRSSLFVRLL
jgi:hypothetical protein